ncbi:coilin [Anastrepha obliqua]|uniref:coilin n=1 Tax=Anastrepha obliqua TaxID=95512 RepID=UPI002409EC50|nr:coilin [Anastrepha obliqua]
MKKFPVKIDLSSFFDDERKYVMLLVDPQWKSVEYLQQRVEQIFDVRPVHFLTNDNLFIPPQESIEVLEFTESLKAFIPKHAVEESRRRSKQFRKPEIENAFTINADESPIGKDLVKKRKYTLGTEILSSSTPSSKKKSKCASAALPSSSTPFSNESQEITSTNEQGSLPSNGTTALRNRNHGNLNVSNRKISYSDVVENQIETINEELDKSIRKRKRKQARKIAEQNNGVNANSITLLPDIPSSTFVNNSKLMGNNSHILFSDDSMVLESTKDKKLTIDNNTSIIRKQIKSPKLVFKCNLDDDIEVQKPLVSPLKVINKSNKAPKRIIDIQENILLPPADIDILTQTSPVRESSTKLEQSNASNTLKVTNGSQNIEARSGIETENIEKDSNLEYPKNNINNDFESTKDFTEFGNENRQSDLSITIGVENPSALDATTKENENDSYTENVEEKTQSEKENVINHKEIVPNNVKDETEHFRAANGSQSEAKDEKLQKSLKETSTATKADTSEGSKDLSALDESSVIDLDDEDEDVINLSDDQQSLSMNHSARLSEILSNSISTMGVAEMMPFCTPLIGIPSVGDIVIFKFNRGVLSEKSDLSEFIACKCEHVNRRTKVLKLLIIDSSLENDFIPPQYMYNTDESLTNTFINIKLPEMIDAKVLQT